MQDDDSRIDKNSESDKHNISRFTSCCMKISNTEEQETIRDLNDHEIHVCALQELYSVYS